MNISGFIHSLKEFAYGLFVLDPLLTMVKMRYHLDLMFITLLYGDMLGIPLISPIYKLNLLIFYYPLIERWKLEIVKDKDITDKMRG